MALDPLKLTQLTQSATSGHRATADGAPLGLPTSPQDWPAGGRLRRPSSAARPRRPPPNRPRPPHQASNGRPLGSRELMRQYDDQSRPAIHQRRRSSAPTRLLTNLVERRRLARRANDGLRATFGGQGSATCGLVWLVTVGRVGRVV